MMNITFRKGTVADTERFIGFLAEIRQGMAQKSWFYLDPPDVIRKSMADGTMELWLATENERLAAVFNILYPSLDPCNYGNDLDLCEEDLLRVVHMDTAAVHPDYRGLGLQGKMVRIAEQELSGKGKMILLCTVHPENSYSLNNMLKQGYEIQRQVPKYGSQRYILRKDIF